MKLHTQTKKGVMGFLIFKRPALLMDVCIELDADERTLLISHPEAAKMTVATGTVGPLRTPIEIVFTLGALVGGLKSISFATLSRQTEFEESLRHGCVTARHRLMRLEGLRAGTSCDLEF